MDTKFDVVISGISGKFPECDNVPEFKRKLYNGESFMSQKNDRWPTNYRYKYTEDTIPPATGKLNNPKEFDLAVFKMNNATAECTDVINRSVLEPSFEAIMDAGYNPYELDDRNIGVYMTNAHCESDATAASIGGGRLWVLGSSKTMMSNRVSFALNLTGPSFTLFNDISGTLLALTEAYKNVANGYTEAAIVGVSSAVFHPYMALHLVKINALSMDGMTRVFDKAADGYGRSDSVVAFYIQRAIDAKRMYAKIDFSDHVYFGSNPHSLLAYEEDLLERSLRHMYSQNDYNNLDDISFVEMSACGFQRWDRIEANAIADVFCQRRQHPLLVGSVKSNVGNTEGAAPFVGLIKAILALESGIIGQNISFEHVNDQIRAFVESKLQVVTEPTTLSNVKVAVNGVGMSGLFSQVILKQNPRKRIAGGSVKDNLPRLVLFCGRTEDGTIEALRKLENTPFNTDFISMFNDVFSTDMPFHIYRGYSILTADTKREKKSAIDVKGNTKRPIWFLFSGMGSQWNGMGTGLLDVPIFAETVRKCDRVLKPKGLDIYHILTTDDRSIFDNIVHAFVGIITVQIGLVEILKALGITPDGIIGHSVGENACAYADGCLTLEQAVLSSYARGIASIETETIKGMMAAVGKGYNQIKDSLPENIQVACHNSATSSTLSGPAQEVENFVQQLQSENIFAKAVNVANIAYHSKYIAPAAPNLLARLQEVISQPIERSAKWISTSIPESDWNTPLAKYCSAEYLTNNLLNCVMFEEGCTHIPPEALVIEIAPHGLLQAIIKRSLPETCSNVSLTRRNADNKNIENLLSAIGQIYIYGCNVNVNALYPSIQYPVPRDTPSIAPFGVWYRTSPDAGVFHFDLVGSHSSDAITIRVNDDSPYYYLKHHKINNQIYLPTSLFLYLAWWVFSIDRNIKLGSLPIAFEDIRLFKNLTISQHKPKSFTVFIQRGSGKFEILKCSKSDQYKTTQIMTGIIYQPEKPPVHVVDETSLRAAQHTITSEQYYDIFKNVGYQLTNTFGSLDALRYNETDCYGQIKWQNNWVSFIDSLLKFSMFSEMKNSLEVLYPYKIRTLEINAAQISSLETGNAILCHKESRTKIITCEGLKMTDVKTDCFVDRKNNITYQLEGLRFVSHKNPNCQKIQDFLRLSLQIAIDNMATSVKNHSKLILIEHTTNLTKILKETIKDNHKLKSKITHYRQTDEFPNTFGGKGDCLFVVTDRFDEIIAYKSDSVFVLQNISSNESITDKSFVEISRQSFADSELRLYKKKTFTINGHLPRIIVDDITLKEKYPTSDLEPTFIIKKTTDAEDLSLIFADKKPTDPRYLFLMDDDIPNESSLKEIILQDLPVAIYKNGEWGSYRTISENTTTPDTTQNLIHEYPKDIQLESIHVQYLGFDRKLNSTNAKICSYGVEYSGINRCGEKVMGLTIANPYEPITEPDPNLMWSIPDNWTLEEAVTVPFVYSQAFNLLRLIRGHIFTNSVLVNIGEESLLAEACISISLSQKHTVYVNVSDYQEASIIKNKFPQIADTNIFNQQDHNYEIEILKVTKGQGVDMVINCLPGIQHISAGLNCVGQFGHCVQIGDVDAADIDSLGLQPFLKSISLIVIPHKISTLYKLSVNDKRKIIAYVADGIKTGIVTPFRRTIRIPGIAENALKSKQQKYVKTIYKCHSENETRPVSNHQIRFDNNHSYIIVGGEKKDTSWFELVEWLINKGARKFIIAVDNFTVGTKISHQMNRLLNQKKATIILTSSQKVATVQDAVQLIEEASIIAPLEVVFFTSLDSADKKIHNMDIAARQTNRNFHLVSLFSGGLRECESRRLDGSSAFVFHAEKSSRKLSNVLPLIDDLLISFDDNSPILYRITNHVKQLDASIVRNYLPRDIRLIESIADDLSDNEEFREVTTLSPRFANVKGTTPIFVISALGPKPLQPLFSKLLYPAYCTNIARHCQPAFETASTLYKSLNRIQNKGAITLISETWRSPATFELIKLISRDDRQYKLFLLESNPLMWKDRIKPLGPIGSQQFENNLITHLFTIDSKTRIENFFHSTQSLEQKIDHYLSKQNHLPTNTAQLASIVDIIRHHLVTAFEYEYNDELIKHTISLVQQHTERSINFSITSEQFIHEQDDYYKFIGSMKITQKINDEVMHNMWYTID